MNWRNLLAWGVIVGALVILALPAEGRWLFVGLCVAVGVAGLAFDVWRARRQSPDRSIGRPMPKQSYGVDADYRALLVLLVAVMTPLGGCGDENTASQTRDASRPSNDASSRHWSAWSDDATAYITTLENCLRRVNPVPGSWNVCTRSTRRGYEHSAEQVLKSKLSGSAPSRACRRTLSRAKSRVEVVTRALNAAWRAVGSAIRAANTSANGAAASGSNSGGSAASTLDRARRITERGTKPVARLSAALRSCA